MCDDETLARLRRTPKITRRSFAVITAKLRRVIFGVRSMRRRVSSSHIGRLLQHWVARILP